MFNFFKKTFSSLLSQVGNKISSLFSRSTIDDSFFKELESVLIKADTGTQTTQNILEHVRTSSKGLQAPEIKTEFKNYLATILNKQPAPIIHDVVLLVGINGTGKTTCAGKLAHMYEQQGKKVLLVAGDTFRAAATEQLQEWAKRTGADIIIGKSGQDSASVIFEGCTQYLNGKYDKLIIDTAGRLQNKTNLMKELEKIKRIIAKQLSDQPVTTLLTVDAMLGQNSFEQAQIFNETTKIDGIILTKMDGSGKGGIIFAIIEQLHIPVAFISFGEKADDIAEFNKQEYLNEFVGF